MLRGRCRTCRAAIGLLPLVWEIAGGMAGAAVLLSLAALI